MLRPLVYLVSLCLLAGVAVAEFDGSSDHSGSGNGEHDFSEPTELNISSCPITFYGETFETLYVSFENERFVICFRDFYNAGVSDDCIIGAPAEDCYGDMDIGDDNVFDADISTELPDITGPGVCYVALTVEDDVTYRLHNFGTQAVLFFSGTINDPSGSTEFQVLANDSIIQTQTLTSGGPDSHYFDLSGCRFEDIVYEPDTDLSFPERCLNLVCSPTAELETTECRSMERCLGNGSCVFDRICTASGPAVIDFTGEVDRVPDRCGYALLTLPSRPDFQVLANFQERRRKDVSFLDSVTVRVGLPDVDIQLGPNGMVQVNGTMLSVGGTAVTVHDVNLSKDQRGIMAEISLTNHTAFLFFDGRSAQIRLEGQYEDTLEVEGLCGNSSHFPESSISDISPSNCETQYSDVEDSAINCTLATARCHLLKEEPFTDCHDHIDPMPYINACKDTLCRYPTVDGLDCQFFEDYARVCSLHLDVDLETWRPMTSCPPPAAFCRDRVCLENEFCGVTLGGKSGCFCRGIFASPYREANMFAEPTVCGEGSGSVTLIGCFLEENSIDYTDLHLNDQSCRGQLDTMTNTVTFSFNDSNSCGTVVMGNDSHVVYKNSIKLQNSSADDVIVRTGDVQFDFSCTQKKPGTTGLSFKIHNSSVVQHITTGVWDYILTMEAFTDASRTQLVTENTEIILDQKIWVELKTEGLSDNLVSLVTDSCWATSEPQMNASLRYDLITDGCANPADQTMRVEGNGMGLSNFFSFNMFQFSGSDGDVFLHCRLNLCVKQTNNCVPSCSEGNRRRRSATFEDVDSALISMVWTS